MKDTQRKGTKYLCFLTSLSSAEGPLMAAAGQTLAVCPRSRDDLPPNPHCPARRPCLG